MQIDCTTVKIFVAQKFLQVTVMKRRMDYENTEMKQCKDMNEDACKNDILVQ